MANRGRPTLCKPEYVGQARKMCLLGATNQELADCFEVDRSIIDNWLKAHPEFAEAVYEGRDGADAEIAQKLHEHAMGCPTGRSCRRRAPGPSQKAMPGARPSVAPLVERNDDRATRGGGCSAQTDALPAKSRVP